MHCAEIVPCAPPRRSAPNQTIRIGRAVGWLMRGAYRAALPGIGIIFCYARTRARDIPPSRNGSHECLHCEIQGKKYRGR